MKRYTLLFLIFLSFKAAAREGVEHRAGPLPIDPVPPTGADPTNTGASVTSTAPTGTSNTNNPTSTGTTSTTTPPVTASSSGLSASTGLPSVSAPSISASPSSTDTSATLPLSSDGTSTSFTTILQSDSSSITSSSSSAAPTNTDGDGGNGNDSSVGTGTIVGLSVAGGIAVLGVVAFVIWKFTRKRFSEFDADGEEIKWPELGHESHALPTRQTGRSGVDDDGYDEAGIDGAGRRTGNYAPSTTTGEASMADLHSYNDPYAVPPLPHLDPNQPYHDDPTNYGGHYDPYQGPVPQSFHDPASVDRTNSMSPAPVNYGRQSPGPSLSYTRTGY